jgi:hypothetical protein
VYPGNITDTTMAIANKVNKKFSRNGNKTLSLTRTRKKAEQKIRIKTYQKPTVIKAYSLKKGRKKIRTSKILQTKGSILDFII